MAPPAVIFIDSDTDEDPEDCTDPLALPVLTARASAALASSAGSVARRAIPPASAASHPSASSDPHAALRDSTYGSKTSADSTPKDLLSEDELARNVIEADSSPRKRTASEPEAAGIPPSKHPRVEASPPPPPSTVGIQICAPTLVNPKSMYQGFKPPLPISKETDVLDEFLAYSNHERGRDESPPPEYPDYSLEDFCVYFPGKQNSVAGAGQSEKGGKRRAGEMAVLSDLNVKGGTDRLLVDGVLVSEKGVRRYVQRMPIYVLSIGNYCDVGTHDVENCVWVQSTAASYKDNRVFYRLGAPARHYERYLTPFLWLANFSKHLVDFMTADGTDDVCLEDFRWRFYQWLQIQHGSSPGFWAWHAQYGREDFRNAAQVHYLWLWQQVWSLSEDDNGLKHLTGMTIWRELQCTIIPYAVPKEKWENTTVVTPYVYECFKHVWPESLKKVQPLCRPKGTMSMVHVEIPVAKRMPRNKAGRPKRQDNPQVKVGDVVALPPDHKTKWKGAGNIWYAYVLDILPGKKQRQQLRLMWMYTPEETILGREKYPYPNELFFSSHCNCDSPPVYADEVLYIAPTAFLVGPGVSGKEFFVRQLYRTEDTSDPAFRTLKKADLEKCSHDEVLKTPFEEVRSKYEVGDTVLVGAITDKKESILEPAELLDFDEDAQLVLVRVLERRSRFGDSDSARPNDLLYTEETDWINPEFIERRCHVRSRDDSCGEKLPAPYTRDGGGDFYYLSGRLNTETGKICSLGSVTLRQGYDPMDPVGKRRMNGLDLFCGGGNFGRGIEEGGAVQMKWAVDIETVALHGYRSNLKDVNDTALYLGSINNYVEDAILGKYSNVVACPDDVDFISAGSPCQGFSNANQTRDSARSLRNSSLVASVAACVDVFRPKYALLENVAGIATTYKWGNGEQCNVFGQLVCCLVGMGYQCQQWTLDSWSYGNPQTRTRLFLSITAPGLPLPPRPPRTHSHPPGQVDRQLFKAPNGFKFGGRELEGATPFPFVSAREGFGDLPSITDAHVGVCIPFPDHRTSRVENWDTRLMMGHIPRWPTTPAPSWRSAIDTGRLPKKFHWYLYSGSTTKYGKKCRTFSRIPENRPCRTITTSLTPQCSFTGQWVHYDQHRLITVMEARRAQGFPDDEVLAGHPAHAFKIVGNSVARGVSMAWGLSIRDAWMREDVVDDPKPNEMLPAAKAMEVNTAEEVSASGDACHDALDTPGSQMIDTPGLEFITPAERMLPPGDAHTLEGDDATSGSDGAPHERHTNIEADPPLDAVEVDEAFVGKITVVGVEGGV